MLRTLRRIALALVALVVVLIAAILFCYGPRTWSASGARPANAKASPAQLRATIESLPPFRSVKNAEVLASAEELVAARLRALGWTVELQPVQRAPNPYADARAVVHPTHNLIATRSLVPTGPTSVIGAHLDAVSVSPGADDNGSGVAVLLELARILSPEAASHVRLCFFNEEESGLYGSFTFVGLLSPQERARIDRAFILDMVGHFDARPHSQNYPPPLSWLAPDHGDFLAAITLTDSDRAAKELRAARDRSAPELSFVLFEPARFLANCYRDIWRSDHAPFWHANIPAIFITDTGEFRSKRYHSPDDSVDAVDFDRVASLTDAIADVLESAAR